MNSAFVNPLARNAVGVINSARSIKLWTREILLLPEETVVSVNELACHVPGCPPKETVVLVMRTEGTDQVSMHKAMQEITREDLIVAFDLNRRGH